MSRRDVYKRQVLEELGILKLYVERMPKSAGIEFEAAPYFSEDSVGTTSTHDCAPVSYTHLDVYKRQPLCRE